MTWIYAGHTTPSTDETVDTTAVWMEILRTYLVTRTGWTITEDPADPRRTFCDYTFTNGVTGQPYTWYQCQNGTVLGERRRYDVTPGDNGTLGEGPYINLSGPVTNEVHRIWYSDENDRDFLVTKGKKIVFWACAQDTHMAWSGPNGPGWAPNTRRSGLWMSPFTFSAAECAGGPVWMADTTSTSTHYYVKPAIGFSGESLNSGDQVLFSSFTIVSTKDSNTPVYLDFYSWPLVTVNKPDILLHVTCNTTTTRARGTGLPHALVSGLLVQYDGKYWMRANPDMLDISYMFDFGATEPNFSLAPD